jgi:uncharacterized protein YdeI (YjbR/CyaY-like superfamily)
MTGKTHDTRLRVRDLGEWTRWLKEYHASEKVVWLVFLKKGAGSVPFDYPAALDEALCYGWVDSLVKTIDEKEYMRKFTPRKPTSTWSDHNKKRVEKLIGEGRMTPAGMRAIGVAKKNGMWERGVTPPEVNDRLPDALLNAFQAHPAARDNYFALSNSVRKQYNIWINMAKRAETVGRRVEEAIEKLERGEELGLK